MTKDALLELADRCEREEGSRELDVQIVCLVREGNLMDRARLPRDMTNFDPLESVWPKVTSSLDAAVTLVPEGASVNLGSAITADGAVWRAVVGGGMACWAATPALALCAAALRARASLTEKE